MPLCNRISTSAWKITFLKKNVCCLLLLCFGLLMKNNISKHVQLYEFYGFSNCAYKLLHYLIFNLLIPLVLLNPANWMSWVRVDNVNRIFNPLETYVQKYNIVQNYKELLLLLLFYAFFVVVLLLKLQSSWIILALGWLFIFKFTTKL